MKKRVFDEASYKFPWHVEWNRQDEYLKGRFLLRQRMLFPGHWSDKFVMHEVGVNLKEKRTRLRKEFREKKDPKMVVMPAGCTKESFLRIWEDMKDPIKAAKSLKCKRAADLRMQTIGCRHRCGRGGYGGIIEKFVSFFPHTYG
jgi:hypothetical protein